MFSPLFVSLHLYPSPAFLFDTCLQDPVIADNVNTTLVAHFGAVGASNAQLAAYLTPKDNYKTPSWCVWKPPAA